MSIDPYAPDGDCGPPCNCTERRIGKGGREYIYCTCPPPQNTRPSLQYGIAQSAWRRLSRKIIARDGGRCTYCGTTTQKMQCDHVVPWTRGGTNEETNLVAACSDCNRSKKNKLLSEWRRPQ